jgi:hypothetical protein
MSNEFSDSQKIIGQKSREIGKTERSHAKVFRKFDIPSLPKIVAQPILLPNVNPIGPDLNLHQAS